MENDGGGLLNENGYLGSSCLACIMLVHGGCLGICSGSYVKALFPNESVLDHRAPPPPRHCLWEPVRGSISHSSGLENARPTLRHVLTLVRPVRWEV